MQDKRDLLVHVELFKQRIQVAAVLDEGIRAGAAVRQLLRVALAVKLVRAFNPALWPLYETSKVMGFVVPSSVRFPVTLYAEPPRCSTCVLRKAMVGYCFTAKKALER